MSNRRRRLPFSFPLSLRTAINGHYSVASSLPFFFLTLTFAFILAVFFWKYLSQRPRLSQLSSDERI